MGKSKSLSLYFNLDIDPYVGTISVARASKFQAQIDLTKKHIKSLYEGNVPNYAEAEKYSYAYSTGGDPVGEIEYKKFLFFMLFAYRQNDMGDFDFGLKKILELNTRQINFILTELLPTEREEISKFNTQQINNWFSLSEPDSGFFLNSNPGADIFWGSFQESDKFKLDIIYNFLKAFEKQTSDSDINLRQLYDIINESDTFIEISIAKDNKRYSSAFDFLLSPSGSSAREIGTQIRDLTSIEGELESFFIKNINSLFFEKPGQGNIEQALNDVIVSEGKKKYKITSDDVKEIINISKDDRYYNPYKKILEQNENSTILKYIQDLIDSGLLSEEETEGVDLKKSNASALGVATQDLEAIKELLGLGGEEEFNRQIEQCLLLIKLRDIAVKSRDKKTKERILANDDSNGFKYYPYGGRIYDIDATGNNLINGLSGVTGMHDFVKSINENDYGVETTGYKYRFRLYKVVETEDGEEREYPFLFKDAGEDIYGKPVEPTLKTIRIENYNSDGAQTGSINNEVLGQKEKKGASKKIAISDFSITIAGDTVATVKSNIDVSINFDLKTLEAILAEFEAQDPYNENKKYSYSLSEILSHDVMGTVDGTNAARALKTAYTPKKNRLILKIIPIIEDGFKKNLAKYFPETGERSDIPNDIKNYLDSSIMILDLNLVNYTAKRQVETAKNDKLTVNFKGFVKNFINEPFCDVLNSKESKNILQAIEQETINELNTNKDKDGKVIKTRDYCNIEDVREKMEEHYKAMKTKKDELLQQDYGRTKIFKSLIERSAVYSIPLTKSLYESLKGNVEKTTNRIVDSSKLAGVLGETIKEQKNISEVTTETVDLNTVQNINFFYFGDLVDVLMDSVYDAPKYREIKDGNKTYRIRKLDSLRDKNGKIENDVKATDDSGNDVSSISPIRKKLANFPIKVIMPTFYPVIENNGKFKTSDSKDDVISLSDIPIAVSFFSAWYKKEIIDKKINIYPLASMLIKLLNSLVNNTISDNCYTNGTLEKKYFSMKTDFGYPYTDSLGTFNEERYNLNFTIFDEVLNALPEANNYISFPIVFGKDEVSPPYIKKSSGVKQTVSGSIVGEPVTRSKHQNYIIFYEQFNSFSKADYKTTPTTVGTTTSRTGIKKKNICEFKKEGVTIQEGKNKKTINFTKSISFSKASLPMAEEIRFYNDGLNELSTLSAVHDVTMETMNLFSFYPGMLCFVDPGFLEPPEKYGSIPWIMGLGGFHICSKVVHTGTVKDGDIENGGKTTIEAKFVNSGNSDSYTYKEQCTDNLKILRNPNHKANGAREN